MEYGFNFNLIHIQSKITLNKELNSRIIPLGKKRNLTQVKHSGKAKGTH
jgi:hypothetical protein